MSNAINVHDGLCFVREGVQDPAEYIYVSVTVEGIVSLITLSSCFIALIASWCVSIQG